MEPLGSFSTTQVGGRVPSKLTDRKQPMGDSIRTFLFLRHTLVLPVLMLLSRVQDSASGSFQACAALTQDVSVVTFGAPMCGGIGFLGLL